MILIWTAIITPSIFCQDKCFLFSVSIFLTVDQGYETNSTLMSASFIDAKGFLSYAELSESNALSYSPE